ncbi:MAG: hypothetical protein ACPLRM_06100, partial [Anaerolineae bacterium]
DIQKKTKKCGDTHPQTVSTSVDEKGANAGDSANGVSRTVQEPERVRETNQKGKAGTDKPKAGKIEIIFNHEEPPFVKPPEGVTAGKAKPAEAD